MEVSRKISLNERERQGDSVAATLLGGEDCARENDGDRPPAIPGDLMGYILLAINLIPVSYFVLSNMWYCCTARERRIRNTRLHGTSLHKSTTVKPIITPQTTTTRPPRPTPPSLHPLSNDGRSAAMKTDTDRPHRQNDVKTRVNASLAQNKANTVRRTREHLDHLNSIAWKPSAEIVADHSNEVDTIMKSFDKHDGALEKTLSTRQRKAKRRTQLRLEARTKVSRNRVLSKVSLFSSLSEKAIETVISRMTFEVFGAHDVLCRQGAPADKLFVIVSGRCTVRRNVSTICSRRHSVQQRHAELLPIGDVRCVATLKPMDFFGEGCIEQSPGGAPKKRDATVMAHGVVHVLSLKSTDIHKLEDSGVLTAEVITGVHAMHEKRSHSESTVR
mgnify:FL=1